MNRALNHHATRGIGGLDFTQEQAATPLFRLIVAALEDELKLMREQNDVDSDIKNTTLLRGEIRCVKRILARTSEVGPVSRQSEHDDVPESASVASAAGGIPPGYISP